MSREDDFATRMEADATLMSTLTGGVFTVGEIGQEGISRDTTPTAFDANGFLKPCALIRQRPLIRDNAVYDHDSQHVSAAQRIEIYVYQDRGYSSIDTALARLYVLFQGYTFSDGFPLEWLQTLDRERDNGALDGASLARQDWLLHDVLGE